MTKFKEGKELKRRQIDLESYWSPWKDVEEVKLTRGIGFDKVVLGISLGALPDICEQLIDANDGWRKMVDEVKTVRTQAFQLWLKPILPQLGWQMPSPCITAYTEPMDTWADMSHLIDRESWTAENGPKNIAYFCGPMEDDD
jgi:uncharacterized protein with NAD-binding domain and iron-sulfur cluster